MIYRSLGQRPRSEHYINYSLKGNFNIDYLCMKYFEVPLQGTHCFYDTPPRCGGLR